MIKYNLIRSNRKTLALHIKNGALEARAPLNMPVHEIEEFVRSKESWIAGKLAMSEENARRREKFSLDYGDMAAYLGKEYPIVAKLGDRVGFDGVRFFIPSDLTSEQIKSACIQIYRLLAKSHIARRVRHFAKQMSISPSAVKINSAKTRWGSCSSEGSLNFSWRLILADSDVVDYVVVHELAHMIEMNHSPCFWAIVESILPDFRHRQARLKQIRERVLLL